MFQGWSLLFLVVMAVLDVYLRPVINIKQKLGVKLWILESEVFERVLF